MADQVLLIRPESAVRSSVEQACAELAAELQVVDDHDSAAARVDAGGPVLLLSDFETFSTLRKDRPGLGAVLLAERADSEQAIEWMKLGVLDYVIKPLKHDVLVRAISDALHIYRELEVPPYEDVAERPPAERIVGESPTMQEVYKLIGLIAPRDVNVLITGESGTGKELVARALWHHSARKERPFLAVNCAAIPETLLESELFGHEKGAFTGADGRHTGKFEQCDKGTLFLDEIGDIPLPTQAKLLRVLQDQSFQRLGGTTVLRCDVRILAATNQPLERMIAEKRFREDLFYRLKVAAVEVPPLREREVDVVLLAHYFVRRFSRQLKTRILRFSPRVLPLLLNYPWPGNVRELENVIKASLVVARGSVFQPAFLPEKLRNPPPAAEPAGAEPLPAETTATPATELRSFAEALASDPRREGRLHREAVERVERELIRTCLLRTRGRVAPAAKMLGIPRTTLRRKINQLGVRVETDVQVDPAE